MAEQQQLSGTIVVIIIAMAVQVCIMLVIVVKRQIMRFALRNRRGPHTHIGQGGPKALRREIDRRLDYVSHIKHEPPLISDTDDAPSQTRTSHRIAAVEEIRSFENDLACFSSGTFIRAPCGNLRSFLLNCIGGPLRGLDHYLIHQICDDYDHARHHFEDFNQEKLNVFQSRVSVLRQRLESNRSGAANWTSTSLGDSPSLRDQASKKKGKKSKEKKQQQQRESRALLVTSTNSANCTPV